MIGKHISIFYCNPQLNDNLPFQDLQNVNTLGDYKCTVLKLNRRNIPFVADLRIEKLSNSDIGAEYKFSMADILHKALNGNKLENIKNKFFPYFNNQYTGIFRFNLSDMTIILANDKAKEIFGVHDIQGAKLNDLFATREEYMRFYDLLVQKKQLSNYEFKVCQKCGDERWVYINCSIFMEEGYAEGILLDITSRKKQLIELNRLNEDLDRFIYHASHDLRAPLSTILGLVNVFEMEGGNDPGFYADLIREKIFQLDELLSELVQLTHNRKTEPNFETIDLIQTTKYIIADLNNAGNVKINLNFEVSEIKSDFIRFKTILRNILSNALKYYDASKESPMVDVSFKVLKNQLIITIRDNGIGIDRDHLPNLYDMFYRATRQSSGSGLGLAIVKEMVDKIGGTISVSSQLAKGTTFLVTLPIEI
jgi:hypothetical protein